MIGLKPCPFCGGGAHIKEVVSACETLYTVGCSDSECMGYETWLLKPTKEEAIAAWNRRAERTCSIGYEYEGEPFFHAIHVHELTCGHDVRLFEDVPRYCPYCGARVVDE